MRISDWSSDVCSSDLRQAGDLVLEEAAVIGEPLVVQLGVRRLAGEAAAVERQVRRMGAPAAAAELGAQRLEHPADRKSVGSGKRVSVRVDLGGRRKIEKKNVRSKISVNCNPYI